MRPVFKYTIFVISALWLMACAPANNTVADAAPPRGVPVSTATVGQVCGGMVAGPEQECAGENEYCHREMNDMCGAADAPGVCREKPQMCTMDYTPVCGCDGKSYPNECAANSEGVSAAYLGECK